ncbi:potassium channel protein [bacterium]|nr:potassium channel protein [bacterium]
MDNNVSMGYKIFVSMLLLGIVTMIGTFGYMQIEEWAFFDSLYMTIITLSTVGFGEVRPLTPAGRFLTLFVILSGLTVAAYALGTITTYIVGGMIITSWRRKRMEHKIKRLKNHIIVAGYGKLGRSVVESLVESGEDFCIIEQDSEKTEYAISHGYLTIEGDATEDEILEKAGILNARGLIAAMSGDANNVLTTITARTINPKIKIAARGSDSGSEIKLRRAGADRVELPFSIGGNRLAQMITKPNLVDFLDTFVRSYGYRLRFEEYIVSPSSKLNSVSISEADIRNKTGGAMILAIHRKDQEALLHPSGDFRFTDGDRMLVLGDEDQLESLRDNYKLT